MSPPVPALRVGPPSAEELRAALGDGRVTRAVWQCVRDERMRQAFRRLRAQGSGGTPAMQVEAAIRLLCGPHRDETGRVYYLSEERVRAIVYAKTGRTPSRR